LAVSGAAQAGAERSRFVMQSKIDAKRARVSEDFAPAVRRSMAPAADEPVVGSAEEPSEMAPAADEPVVESAESARNNRMKQRTATNRFQPPLAKQVRPTMSSRRCWPAPASLRRPRTTQAPKRRSTRPCTALLKSLG
jgi:hypothetical protein